ncbi:hypothetical protein CHCC20335_3260 [Bacillus paralicheniformis]|nr:hypothetical protein CHCC20335_3260 [Bacillus paralicheniformis]
MVNSLNILKQDGLSYAERTHYLAKKKPAFKSELSPKD